MSEKNLNRMRALRPLASRDYRLLFAAVGIEVFGTGMWTIVMVFQVLALDDSPLALSAVATGMSLGLFAFSILGWRGRRSVLQTPHHHHRAGMHRGCDDRRGSPVPHWRRSSCGTSASPRSRWAPEARSSTPPTAPICPRCFRLSSSSPRTGSKALSDPQWGRASVPPSAESSSACSSPPSGRSSSQPHTRSRSSSPCSSAAATSDHAPLLRRNARACGVTSEQGVNYVVRTRWLLWTLIFGSSLALIIQGPIEVLLPFLTRDRFEDAEATFGFLLAAFGIGGAIGSLVVSSLKLPRRYLTFMIACWGGGTLPLVVIGVADNLILMLAALFIVGAATGAGVVIWGTLLQRLVPLDMIGRVASLDFFVSIAFMPVSIAIAGPLSLLVPIPVIFIIAGIAPPVLALIALLAGRMRESEMERPLDER
jgi:MFS family permease